MKVENSYRWKSCPLCMSSDIYQIGELSYTGKISFSSVEIELKNIPEMWKCQRCRSAFVQNIVAVETARSLYSMGQAGARWPSNDFDKMKTDVVVQIIKNIFKSGGSVLDIGCNTGELLDLAHDFGCVTSGVEYSSSSRAKLASKGHQAYSIAEEAPGEFEVITAFDVVEHLYDVPAFLSDCANKLAENGRLVVMTGNVDCLSAKLSGPRWWYAQFPEHIVFPSTKYFSDYSGLRIEKRILSYAAKSFEYPKYMGLLALLNALLGRRKYTGLPSIVADHVLIVLKK
ncbi:MAG: hypothetical protein AMJ53_04955 [Gammaproteobacteria bacterium SG8_11]|nr:MAG: hypothetical protein AMJ53_04955 [Gammaproteobacteria bacterium SG8_11]